MLTGPFVSTRFFLNMEPEPEECPVQANFNRVAELLPYNYGKMELYCCGDGTKQKQKKKNLKKALKNGYIWDTYCPLSFAEWRGNHGYSDAECESSGIKINDTFHMYQKYRNKEFTSNRAVNSKLADIQTFNLICNLVEKKTQKKRDWGDLSSFGMIGCF